MSIKFNPLLFSGFDNAGTSGGGGGSPTIGGSVVGGTNKSVLFVNPTGSLNQDNANFSYDNGTTKLSVTGGILTASLDRSTSGTLAIGTSVNSTVINIGNSGATVNIQGTTIFENTTTLNVSNPVINLNVGAGVGSGSNSGINVEENNIVTGYAQTSSDRNSWIFKAPNTAGIVTVTPGSSGFTINQGSHNPVTLATFGSSPNSNGASLSTQVLTLQPADATNPGGVSTTTQSFAGAKTFTITVAVGTGNVTSGLNSFASGNNSTASGDNSTATGDTVTASAASAHAEGSSTQATNTNSHAEGTGTIASGNISHAEGESTNASGYASHSEGSTNTASGDYSHVEGQNNTAGSTYSHAEGTGTLTSGLAAHAANVGTTAQGYGQTAIGSYNVVQGTSGSLVNTDNAFIIGNGTDNTHRSNAFAVTYQGNATLAGTISATNISGSSSGTNSGDVTLAAFGSTPNANGLSISGQVLNLQPADSTHPGGISTTTQTIAGAKTFSGDLAVSSTSTTAFTVNTNALIVDATNKALGVGVAPAANSILDLQAQSSATTQNLQLTNYDNAGNAGLKIRRARGTSGSPTAVQSNDSLGFVGGLGYGATAFGSNVKASVGFLAGENWTDSAQGAYLTLNSTPTGSTTRTERVRVTTSGHVLINTTTDNGTDFLQVNGSISATTVTANLTGNASGSAGTVSGTNVVTNSNLSQMAAHTYKGNNTGSTANAIDVTSTQLTADLNLFTSTLQGLVPASGGGTSNFLRADGTFAAPPAGFSNPMTTLGDIIYENATPVAARLAGNITSTKQFLTQTGTGSISAAPAWGAIVAGDIPTLNQSTTGTASNITASSNSTITTLSALSLPFSQLTSVSVNLTSQVSNVLPIANGGTNNGSLSVTAGGMFYSDGTKFVNMGAGTTGQVPISNGTSAPTWGTPSSVASVNYYSGSMLNTTSWSTSSTSQAALTNSGNNTLTTIFSDGITVSAASSNVAGLSITPASSSSVYEITAIFFGDQSAAQGSFFLTDGTINFSSAAIIGAISQSSPITLTGIYAFSSGSAATISIQGQVTGGTLSIENLSNSPSITWIVKQLK